MVLLCFLTVSRRNLSVALLAQNNLGFKQDFEQLSFWSKIPTLLLIPAPPRKSIELQKFGRYLGAPGVIFKCEIQEYS